MILVGLITLPFGAACLALLLSKLHRRLPFYMALLALLSTLGMEVALWPQMANFSGRWFIEWQYQWIPLGSSLHLGVDGLSYVFCVLISLTGTMAVLASYGRGAGFLLAILSTVSALMGLVLSIDLLVFFVFWEAMLIPLYFLIMIFGGNERKSATLQLVVFTQASGLLLLLNLLALAIFYYSVSHQLTFDYLALQLFASSLPVNLQQFFMIGFLAAFLVKLPVVPLHTWIVGVFREAPAPVIIVGIMVKTAVYGLLRFVIPFFPAASGQLSSTMMILGIITLFYGAVVAFGQKDPRKLLAYATVSHMGLVLAGIFSFNDQGLQGVVIVAVTSALSMGGLVLLMDHLHRYESHLSLGHTFGLFRNMPRGGVLALVLVMASVGVPGLGNFVGEVMTLYGVFVSDELMAVLLAVGVLVGAIYFLWLLQQVFFGKTSTPATVVPDVSCWQTSLYGLLIALLLVIGLYPRPLLETLDKKWIQTTKFYQSENSLNQQVDSGEEGDEAQDFD